jgi:hypothetical protein
VLDKAQISKVVSREAPREGSANSACRRAGLTSVVSRASGRVQHRLSSPGGGVTEQQQWCRVVPRTWQRSCWLRLPSNGEQRARAGEASSMARLGAREPGGREVLAMGMRRSEERFGLSGRKKRREWFCVARERKKE